MVHNFRRLGKRREAANPSVNSHVEKLYLSNYAAVSAAAIEWSVVEPSSQLGKVVQNEISLGKKPLTKKVRTDPHQKIETGHELFIRRP